jgi:hypothetical protein
MGAKAWVSFCGAALVERRETRAESGAGTEENWRCQSHRQP